MDSMDDFSSFSSDNNTNMTNNWDVWCSMVDYDYLASVIFICIVMFMGTIANIGLLAITCLNKSLRTPSNIFLINVIVGDLIYILMRGPVYVNKLLGPLCWNHGLVACKMHTYFETVAQYVCILSLTALSIERYMAVVRGLESRQINSRTVKVVGVLVTWIVALVLAIPMALMSYILDIMPICSTVRMGKIEGQLFDLYSFFTMYFVPLLVISTLYVSIAVTLYKSSHTMLNNTRQDANNRRQTSQRRRLAMIFVLITVSFAIFWMPYFIHRLYKHVMFSLGSDKPHSIIFEQISAISALLNACLDPYIVFAMSTVYRKILSKCCQKQSSYCCEKSENLNMNNHNRGNNYHRPSVTLFTSLRSPQSTFVALKRNSPSTVNSDTAL
ncbi:gastrin-releasing peptide receptor-like [Lytechinus variegatus]|uniref:gastrin-releasing peptide receptor-like n=1 Tax=Lytechinus variegatus TaxID=7654 RepID=UPI001BB14C7E|nr:gastrin-releasing peptide receptor-like [Lytechinus variegatus]